MIIESTVSDEELAPLLQRYEAGCKAELQRVREEKVEQEIRKRVNQRLQAENRAKRHKMCYESEYETDGADTP